MSRRGEGYDWPYGPVEGGGMLRRLLLVLVGACLAFGIVFSGCGPKEKVTEEEHANPPGKVGVEMGPKGPQ